MWLERQTGCEVTTTVDGEELTGTLEKLSASNGMLYDVPQENEADGVQYQLQIIAEYTVEM